jgi:hypothetical protein
VYHGGDERLYSIGEKLMPNDHPTLAGFYWHRQIDEGSQEAFEWEVVQVLSEQDGPGIVINGTTFQASEILGIWGPRIPDPDENQEDREAAEGLRAVMAESEAQRRERINDLAAIAMAGLLANGVPVADSLAETAYKAANAMMTEREKRNA